jgi:hypothetical protein
LKQYSGVEAKYDQEFIPMFMTSTNREWFKESAKSIETSNDDNTVSISVKKDPAKFAKNNKNLLDIEFGKETDSESIGVDINTRVNDLIQSLSDKITDKKSGIYLYIHGKDVSFTPSKKEITEYTKDAVKK